MRTGISQVTGVTGVIDEPPGDAAPAGTAEPIGNAVSSQVANAGFARDAVLPGAAVLPVLPALAELLPAGGLARGSVVVVDRPGLLCLALVAAASAAGAWCGVAGIPDLGVAAAAAMGAEARPG